MSCQPRSGPVAAPLQRFGVRLLPGLSSGRGGPAASRGQTHRDRHSWMQATSRPRLGLSPEPGLDTDQGSALAWDRIQAVSEPYTTADPNRDRAGTDPRV